MPGCDLGQSSEGAYLQRLKDDFQQYKLQKENEIRELRDVAAKLKEKAELEKKLKNAMEKQTTLQRQLNAGKDELNALRKD
ncbi:hypothetical protein GIB67_029438 [Kingdonia uniflora]|uniref:Uncharacterized protein n=1 Tax=Kingdonia uniflora TaxID=39325 RepID=A0A7J7NY48_9MAGN|nr:hypothetical protein GIB67_029438 [Kingdonia uniflora]